MVMMVELTNANRSFDDVVAELNKIGDELGLEIRMQRSEIFDAMHRL